MKLQYAPDYSIRLVRESTSEAEPLCEVIVAGKPTGKILQGAVFQAALAWNEYILLFLTVDVPFEEALNIYLLDRHLHVVDYAQMYFMYSTGVFCDLDLSDADTVRFRFLGEKVWMLKLFPQKRFAIPIVSASLGVHRPWALYRRFQLSADALPKPVAPPAGARLRAGWQRR
ncbi:hypothetical protein GTP45_15890 [Pseudoduganella sp. FT55W]|uniref:Uncharacterized protein n=1 Tax=Duganella rivi TaxID=2666083 RepID=A0A7X4GSB5_9BURK|nr:hypothetical protein [Duganella rivi]MYM68299.1 hypothetical protein [Duganella rivi]